MQKVFRIYILSILALVFIVGNLWAKGFSVQDYTSGSESVATVQLSTGVPEISFDEDTIQLTLKNGKNRLSERSVKFKTNKLSLTICSGFKFLVYPNYKYNSPLSLLRLHCILRI
jgi:hypothetical protein